ncbi:hypothetical protein [Hyphomicrobium sp.]|uniref:hypothetical protein n=1 Tax=Hyphomicrobium sp. TaxID=82 RepID=UPI000FC39280|nr:hypothetical protein [Hyphomicrobium sp.]RUO98722.1 MAG: hypothetical protein EKK30_10940 [Hyphomicrobium sp.]
MKRIALIAAALFVVLAAAFGGYAFYFRPSFIFGAPQADAVAATTQDAQGDQPKKEGNPQSAQNARHLVEQLGRIQDQIIRGDRAALADQARLLNEIARVVRTFEPEDWKINVNVRTTLLYVLSGGDARVLSPLADDDTASDADKRLANGIMSFAEGRSKTAREVLENVDPRSLDVSLVGPFALARASLYITEDHVRAINLLDEARLAMPHTAIDEAAARREIPLLVGAGDSERAMMLAISYVREFGRSIYAWKMFREFSKAVAKRPELDSASTVDRIAHALDEKDLEASPELFVDLAGEALMQGRLTLTKAAASEVLSIQSASPANRDRARLYLAAAQAPSDAAGNALKALDQIAADRLSEDDNEISEVAGFIAKSVVGAQSIAPRVNSAADGASPKPRPAEAPKEATAMKASAALDEADKILKKADAMISRSAR